MIHGRFSNIGHPKVWVTLDIVRLENGKMAEHWDVIQDEVSQSDSKSDHPMFGNSFTEF
jgi:predicted SnoaL-like aldol condensation-catalyzing enzyme